MSYLITADIHGNPDWYDHLLRLSEGKVATLIAGDLIDLHDEAQSERAKVACFMGFAEKMEALNRNLVVTSGNHDLDDLELFGDEQITTPYAIPESQWLRFPDRELLLNVSSYNHLREFEDLIVVSIRWQPWSSLSEACSCQEETLIESLCADAKDRSQRSGKPVSYLYHERPDSSYFIESLVRRFSPAFFLSGHEHLRPFDSGPVFRFADTVVINAGQKLGGKSPVTGLLFPAENCFAWHPNGPNREERLFNLSFAEIPSLNSFSKP